MFAALNDANGDIAPINKNLYKSICPECRYLNGYGLLTFYGFKIYEAALISEKESGEIFDSKFVLQIKYLKSFKGKDIARRSIKEMSKIGVFEKGKEKIFSAWLTQKMPDVKQNDILSGVFTPNQGLKLYKNGLLITTQNNEELSKAFFRIWLDEKTSERKLRQNLLQFRRND